MKTALIRTTIWNDDDIIELHFDSKLLYLLIMTSPERGVSNIYKMSNSLASVRTGLNVSQINICKQQLEDKGLAFFYGSYVLIYKSAYVEPKKGKFTESTLQKELSALPEEVQSRLWSKVDAFEGQIFDANNHTIGEVKNNTLPDTVTDSKVSTGTSASLEYIDKDIDIESIDRKRVSSIEQAANSDYPKYSQQDVEMVELLRSLVAQNFPYIKERPARPVDYEIMNKIHRLDKRDYGLIKAVIVWCQQDDFWKQNIRSPAKLRIKFDDLQIRGQQWFKQQQRNKTVKL